MPITLWRVIFVFVLSIIIQPVLPVNSAPPDKTVVGSELQKKKVGQDKEKEVQDNRKSSDILRFSVIWILCMFVGFLIWKIVPKHKPWLKPLTPKEEEEDSAIQIDARSSPTRDTLVAAALEWQDRYRVSPINLSVIAALDAALLIGMSEEHYSLHMRNKKFMESKDINFFFEKKSFIVKASRQAALVPKAQHLEWDEIVFILYDARYDILGAWQMSREAYMTQCYHKERLSVEDYKTGQKLVLEAE
ncbi:MAG: hypothetical protein HQL93_05195 [Magnetococcales bacterium]|nr:hypothetical protein [Magnetococcales bacterium]